MQMKRFLSFILLFVLLSVSFAYPIKTEAVAVTKVEKSYEIAVVFDNSGSMYDNNKRWCRAKYAIEIFASMLDYSRGDKLKIFPMWEVTTDGSRPALNSGGGSHEAIDISSKDDLNKISNMFTVCPQNTPFEPVTEAYNALKKSRATDKWLIVLSDGKFNERVRGEEAKINLQSEFSSLLTSSEIKVQYLGFGDATSLNSNESKGFYAKQSTDTSLKDDLIQICNLVFQRSILPANRLSGTSLTIDLSMRNLIVFAQGSNAKINSLTDENGNNIPITMDSGQRKYSNVRANDVNGNKYSSAPVDDTLAGQVVTFGDCAKGKYTLNYSGTDAIQIFYEPDVDINVTFTNREGVVVDPSGGEISAGEYIVTYNLVDRVTREDVTNSELMGNDVKFNATVKPSSSSNETAFSNGGTIVLTPDSATEILITATYLKDYTISTKDSGSSFPFPIHVIPLTLDFNVQGSVLQPDSRYENRDNTNWQPVRFTASIDGHVLTNEEMSRTEIEIKTSNDISYRYEVLPNEGAYEVYIGYDSDGNYTEPDAGEYSLEALITYTDEYGTIHDANASVKFTIEDPSTALSVSAEVLQSQSWYRTGAHDSWKPIRVSVSADGQPLTDEQMLRTKLDLNFSDEIEYYYEIIPGKSAYNVYIGYRDKETYVEPETGAYDLTAKVTYTDEYGVEVTKDSNEVEFEVRGYPKFLRWLKWIIIILAILLALAWWFFHKSFPKRLTLHSQAGNGHGFNPQGSRVHIGKNISLYDGANRILLCRAHKTTAHYKRKSPSAMIEIDNVRPGANIANLRIGGTLIANEEKFMIADETIIQYNTPAGATKRYQIKINRRN